MVEYRPECGIWCQENNMCDHIGWNSSHLISCLSVFFCFSFHEIYFFGSHMRIIRMFTSGFYSAMHFSAKRGIAIACRLSVCLSVRPSVCPSVTLVNCDHINWNSSKIISPSVSLGRSLFATPTWRVCSKGNTPKFGPKVTHPCWFERGRHSIANCGRMVTYRATVTMESL